MKTEGDYSISPEPKRMSQTNKNRENRVADTIQVKNKKISNSAARMTPIQNQK